MKNLIGIGGVSFGSFAHLCKKTTKNVGGIGSVGFGSFAHINSATTKDPFSAPPIFFLSVEVGEKCQLKCKHCIYGDRKSAKPDPHYLNDVINAVENGLSVYGISFSGKEPTMYETELIDVATLVRRKNQLSILMTNGLRLNKDFVNKLSDNIDYFDISLDGTKKAHDWMRGPGTFEQTLAGIKNVLTESDRKVGVIATAINATIDDHPQYKDIIALADELQCRFGQYNTKETRISLSISLYYGKPNDPMLLDEMEIKGLIDELSNVKLPTRILLTANYAYLFPQVARDLKIHNEPLHYDIPTGIPVMRLKNNTDIVLFNLACVQQFLVRIANDGNVFIGCNHLVLRDHAKVSVGNLNHETLGSIIDRIRREDVPILQKIKQYSLHDCSHWCPDYNLCGGGDILSGIYFSDIPVDPLCNRIEQGTIK